jgi:hypothetical protein
MLYAISVKQTEYAIYFPTQNCGPMNEAYNAKSLEKYAYLDFITW